MKYGTTAELRSKHLKDVIEALNTWAQKPITKNSDALKNSLRTYQQSINNGTYDAIPWNFAYGMNTLNKRAKPGESFNALFGKAEGASLEIRGESPTINPGEEKAPWEE